MFKLKEVNINTLISAICEELSDTEITADLEEDLIYSLDRLENAPAGTILIDVHTTTIPKNYKVQEGYWVINGTAHYMCVPVIA
jgi:hypothetical protein